MEYVIGGIFVGIAMVLYCCVVASARYDEEIRKELRDKKNKRER